MTLAGIHGEEAGATAHTATGTSVKQYSCDRCGRNFRSMTRLRNHARTHPVDVAGLHINLDFLTQSHMSSTPHSQVRSPYQDELLGSRTEEVATTGLDANPASPNKPLAASNTPKPGSPISEVSRRTTRRRSGIPLPTDKIATISSRSARRSLQVTAIQNSHRVKSAAVDLPLTPRRPEVQNGRRVNQSSSYRRHTLSSAAEENLPQSPLLSKTKTRKSQVFTPEHQKGQSQMTDRHEETPTAPSQIKSTTPAIGKTFERTDINKTFTVSPVKSLASNHIKSVTPKISRTPTKSDKLNQRSNSNTPIRKFKPGASLTPKSGMKTPKSGKNTPRSGKNTPRSGKKTPKSDRKTPKSVLQKSGTPKTPTGTKLGTPGLGLNFKCTRCGKGFLSQRMLDLHYVIHVRDSPRACGIPSEVIKKRPRRLKLADKKKPQATPTEATRTPLYACAQCSRVYEHEKFLAAHMKTHGLERPHVCDICQKRFKFLSSLKSHKIVHVGEKSHIDTLKSIEKGKKTENRRLSKAYEAECDALNLVGSVRNVFSIASMKEAVMDEDLQGCPFVCSSCEFKTSHPVDLLKHMKTHSKRRQFTCDKCDRSYASRTNLEVHGKVHVIEKLRHVLATKRKDQ